MRTPRTIAAALVALVIAVGLVPAVGADQLTIVDEQNDVAGGFSGDPATDPRLDITAVDVDHQPRRLEVRVTVAQLTPLDDPAWTDGELSMQVALSDVGGSSGDADLIWSFESDGAGGASGFLVSVSSDDFFDGCPTDAGVDEAAMQYVLTAEVECLSSVPRSIAVQVGTFFYDYEMFDSETFDPPADFAPDEGFSDEVATGRSATVSRIAGPDRIETAIAFSTDRFGDGDAISAVLTSSEQFPDAIAGGPLAAAEEGPLLLTGSDGLDARVEAELVRVLPPGSDVFLLGGTAALSPAVVTGVSQAGFRPRRLAGANRFETAVAVADHLPHDIVLIADGRGFREALIATSAAASIGGVVVLTDGDTLPRATDDFLAHDPSRHLAIGAAAEAAPGAERITAASASELSVKVLDRLQPDVLIVGVATLGSFADALAGAPYLAARHGGLVLTDGVELSAPAAGALEKRRAEAREVLLFGGPGALSAKVADQIRSVLADPNA